MPTYPKIYAAIPRIGSGRDADNALRPDFIGRDGRWPRVSKLSTIFDGHPTHVIAWVMSKREVLDDLRGKSGVIYLGDTIDEARNTLAGSATRIASDAMRVFDDLYAPKPQWYKDTRPSSLYALNEPTTGRSRVDVRLFAHQTGKA